MIDSLGHGGAERSLTELIPALQAAGLETVIVPLDNRPGPLTADARRAGASVVQLRGRSLVHRTFELRKIIKRERPTMPSQRTSNGAFVLRATSNARRFAIVAPPTKSPLAVFGMPNI